MATKFSYEKTIEEIESIVDDIENNRMDIDQLADWRQKNDVSIAILTVPVERAQETADLAIASGMTALWNFTPYRIKVSDNVIIANTSIYAHLAIIYNRMHGNGQ